MIIAGWLQVSFNSPIRYGKAKELFIAAEGMYSGQVCYSYSVDCYLATRTEDMC